MRSVEYERTLDATIENAEEARDFVSRHLREMNCSTGSLRKISIAVDEVFANIARYAYAGAAVPGKAVIRLRFLSDPAAAEIVFIDRGIPYNPLEQEAPDITLSARERKVGGLGIYLTRITMDELSYEYRDGQNILTLRKKL